MGGAAHNSDLLYVEAWQSESEERPQSSRNSLSGPRLALFELRGQKIWLMDVPRSSLMANVFKCDKKCSFGRDPDENALASRGEVAQTERARPTWRRHHT